MKRPFQKRKRPIPERFWEKVNKNGPIPPHAPELGPCWIMCVAPTSAGYTQLKIKGVGRVGCHRLVWFLTYGVWPTLHIMHKCDNPPCVNPAHLQQGTHIENVRDMVQKGRYKGPKKVLAEEQENELKRLYLARKRGTLTFLAKKYGISIATVHRYGEGDKRPKTVSPVQIWTKITLDKLPEW